MTSEQSLKRGWKRVKFGEVARNANLVERDPAASGIERVVGLEHIEPMNLHVRRWNSVEEGTSFNRKFVRGQTLFGKRRAYQRKVAYAEFEGICSGDILTFEPQDPNVLSPELLPFICQSDAFFEHALGTSAGSLSPRTSWKALQDFEFPLPPIDEQKRIAEILWAADAAIEQFLASVANIDATIDAYGKKRFLLHEARRSRPKIPAEWRIGTIADIALVDPAMPKELADDLDVSFIPMEYVNEGGGIRQQEVKPLGEVRKGYTYFEDGDILFAKITPCVENGKGAIANDLVNGVGMGSTEYYVLRVLDRGDIHFLYYLTMSKTFRKRAASWMQGSAGQLRVPRDFVEKRPIVIPDPKSRREIGLMLESLYTQRKEICKHKDAIMAWTSAFLNEQLSGRGANV